MDYYLYNFLSVILGVIIPLLVEMIKGKPTNEDFSLRDLSTVLSILIVYYAILCIYYNLAANEYVFYFFIFIHIALTAALISAVVRFTPLKECIKRLLDFPQFKLLSGSYSAIILFFLYTSFTIFISTESLAGRLEELGPADLIMLEAIHNSPLIALPVFILTELFGVVGEEIVCRYFAIGALRQKLGRIYVIVVSSLIWTLMHWDANPSIFILGLLLGYSYYKTESLSICILLHFLYNLAVLTMPFYLFFNQTIAFSSFQYVSAVFVLQILLYHAVEMLFVKTGKTDN